VYCGVKQQVRDLWPLCFGPMTMLLGPVGAIVHKTLFPFLN
jgi:hypothetical protein